MYHIRQPVGSMIYHIRKPVGSMIYHITIQGYADPCSAQHWHVWPVLVQNRILAWQHSLSHSGDIVHSLNQNAAAHVQEDKNCRQTCLPQNTSVRAPNRLCLYFQIFDQIFCGCTTNHWKQNSVKGQIFYHSTSKKQSVNSHLQFNTDALHSDGFILFTSVKVILDRRPQNTFSKNNALCVLLSLMPTHPFLNGCCLVGVCFLGFVHSSSSSSVLYSHLSPTASYSNPPCIGRWLTSVKFWCKVDVHWFNKLFGPIMTSHILQPEKWLEIYVNER